MDVVCNLLPGIGGVDIGGVDGPPIPTQELGNPFAVPIYVNTGGKPLGAVELEIAYDTALRVPANGDRPQVVRGADWPASAIFEAVQEGPGLVRLGGAVSANDAPTSGRLHLATITFIGGTVTGSNPADILGTVITLASSDLQGTPIGAPTPRPIVAGAVTATIVAGRRRRGAVGPRERRSAYEHLEVSSVSPRDYRQGLRCAALRGLHFLPRDGRQQWRLHLRPS